MIVPVKVNDERCATLPEMVSDAEVAPSENVQPSVMPGVNAKLTRPTFAVPEIVLPIADIDPIPTSAHPFVSL